MHGFNPYNSDEIPQQNKAYGAILATLKMWYPMTRVHLTVTLPMLLCEICLLDSQDGNGWDEIDKNGIFGVSFQENHFIQLPLKPFLNFSQFKLYLLGKHLQHRYCLVEIISSFCGVHDGPFESIWGILMVSGFCRVECLSQTKSLMLYTSPRRVLM